MGRRTEYTFSQKGQTHSQQTQGKTLNIANHEGNANQNHKEMTSYICQTASHQKHQK